MVATHIQVPDMEALVKVGQGERQWSESCGEGTLEDAWPNPPPLLNSLLNLQNVASSRIWNWTKGLEEGFPEYEEKVQG